MNFNELSQQDQAKVKEELSLHSEKSNEISVEDIQVEKEKGILKVRYKDIYLELSLKTPDQETTNTIWKMFALAAIVIGSILVGVNIGKAK